MLGMPLRGSCLGRPRSNSAGSNASLCASSPSGSLFSFSKKTGLPAACKADSTASTLKQGPFAQRANGRGHGRDGKRNCYRGGTSTATLIRGDAALTPDHCFFAALLTPADGVIQERKVRATYATEELGMLGMPLRGSCLGRPRSNSAGSNASLCASSPSGSLFSFSKKTGLPAACKADSTASTH
ncbi:hypothetical protein DIPPA_30332 [Diplonema papillatum]|nr:hypothetical protein DIPPA_30332 [Diplonema papillatum]